MAATFEWDEDNGTAAGSPARGATTATARTDSNWKSVDDSTTTYSSSPINAGANSMPKNQFGKFSGTWNQIQSGLFAHTAGAFGTGIALKAVVTSTYATPTTTTDATCTNDITTSVSIASGLAVLFNTSPAAASPSASILSTTSNPAYSQYCKTQMQTTTSAAAGDTTTVTTTLQYQEN